MGTVFAGTDSAGARVAVKRVHPEYAHDPDFRARFHREVQVLQRVAGDCLVPLVDADATAVIPWLATPYIPGLTLQQHLQAHGPLTGVQLHLFAAGCSRALATIHQAGVVHRDLKPGNVILSPAGPRVLDFGIAHTLDGTAITRTGVMTGTPGWISPEQYRDGTAGPAADVFALGALIAYAATGRAPFGEGPVEAVAVRVMAGTSDLGGVPEELLGVVESALATDPAGRPPASAMAEQTSLLLAQQATQVLGPLGEQETVAANLMAAQWHIPTLVEGTWPAHRGSARRSRTLATIGVATALLAAGTTWAFLHSGTSTASAAASTQHSSHPATATRQSHAPSAPPQTPTTAPATSPPAAAPQAITSTQTLTFSPWSADNQPAQGITVTATHSGHCWEQAMGSPRDDAWRCIDNATNIVRDPCFTTAAESQMLCPISTDLTRMVLLTPDGSLPVKSLNGPSTTPLALQLADGQVCRTALGGGAVPSNINGQSLTYACSDGDVYGMPDQTSPVWTVTYRPTGSAYSTTQTVKLALM